MNAIPSDPAPTGDDARIAEAAQRERSRLLHFIRRRLPDPEEAEDVLQDVLADLVDANRLLMPIEHITGWLFRVTRNRITDLLRKKRAAPWPADAMGDDDALDFADLLPSPEDGPDALRVRAALLEAIEAALAELPRDQREVFVAHELDGRSFKEIAAATGVSVNTLLSRKRYAVLHLRELLHDAYAAFDEE